MGFPMDFLDDEFPIPELSIDWGPAGALDRALDTSRRKSQ